MSTETPQHAHGQSFTGVIANPTSRTVTNTQ